MLIQMTMNQDEKDDTEFLIKFGFSVVGIAIVVVFLFYTWGRSSQSESTSISMNNYYGSTPQTTVVSSSSVFAANKIPIS